MLIQDKRYLLNLEQFHGSRGETLYREAFGRLDGERRRKIVPVKNAAVRAASAGAGLLVQKALWDYISGRRTERFVSERPEIQCFSVEELLAVIGDRAIEPCYEYGENGKPYLTDYPFHFNLSHSGQYVFLGVSGQEIGVDIQKIQQTDELRLAKRFFSGEEYKALEDCKDPENRRQMFFRMWTRKEAYGKLTGQGLAGAIGKDFWTGYSEERIFKTKISEVSIPETKFSEERNMGMEAPIEGIPHIGVPKSEMSGAKPFGKKLFWEEYDVPPDYKIACVTHFIEFADNT